MHDYAAHAACQISILALSRGFACKGCHCHKPFEPHCCSTHGSSACGNGIMCKQSKLSAHQVTDTQYQLTVGTWYDTWLLVKLRPKGVACSVLSCPVLSCPVLSCPVLSCPVLSCPVLFFSVKWHNPCNWKFAVQKCENGSMWNAGGL